jgi:energy-coupling factor transporter ATP-binding protein EcfA2
VVEGLRFAYPPLVAGQQAPTVIQNLDLRIEQGEWLAIMGASDSGKTTLCLLLAGLAPHFTGGHMEGRIVIAGRNTRESPPPALASTAGLLFQEPEAQLFNATVEAEVAWGLENLGLPPAEIRARLDEVLDQLHLQHLRQRPPGELSGGEKKRLALASVLAMRPPVLILDEPMGGLDPVGRVEVLDALAGLRRHHATTIIMTESDPEAVATFADRVIVLHKPGLEGGIVALEGTPRQLFSQTDRLASLGIGIPQMAQIATTLNRHLGTCFDFLTVNEARDALAVYLG